MKIGIPSDVVYRNLAGESVLLNIATGNYFGLDAVGTRMWNLLAEHQSTEKVIEHLLLEYEVSESTLRIDLDGLVTQLQKKGLIRVYD
jgi:hypothetical protein